MSPHHSTFGADGLKSRPTRSLAAVAPRSTIVVRTLRRPDSPSKPWARMIRATRLHDGLNPWRSSQACTLGAPYVRAEHSQIASISIVSIRSVSSRSDGARSTQS